MDQRINDSFWPVFAQVRALLLTACYSLTRPYRPAAPVAGPHHRKENVMASEKFFEQRIRLQKVEDKRRAMASTLHTLVHAPPSPATDRLGTQAASKRSVTIGLATPCHAHRAPAGQPCWSISGDDPKHPVMALCSTRVAAGIAGPSARPPTNAAREGVTHHE